MAQFKVLLTLDLPDYVTSEEREKFYQSLKNSKWHKMSHITTVWKTRFEDGTSYSRVVDIVLYDLQNAKKESGVDDVSYNFLISENDIHSGTL